MKKKILLLTLCATSLWSNSAFSYYKDGEKPGIQKPAPNSGNVVKSAQCAPASAKYFLKFNDVNALIENGGSMFQNRASGVSAYEVPKGSNRFAIFSGSLWMGGVDFNNQLKLAALTFRSGNDFWPGPLGELSGGNYDPTSAVGYDVIRPYGGATITPEQCLAYDKFDTITKALVIKFNTWWECTPPNNVNYPDHTAEECASVLEAGLTSIEMLQIKNWPAHGDVSLYQDKFLAPFYDRDGNGQYDPINDGDYPWYDDIVTNRDDIPCGKDRRVSLYGDATCWWVFNDNGNIHTETNGDPIGMEIRAQAFVFATSDEVNKMTFYNYELVNRGTTTLYNTYFSQFLDPDIGYYNDDYVACDVSRGLGIAYNGEDFDPDMGGKYGYGENPPAIGVDFFEGPYLDADGIDNQIYNKADATHLDGDTLQSENAPWIIFSDNPVQTALTQNGIVYKGIGIGYSDSIIDNERFGMRRFTYFTGGGAVYPFSDPKTASQYYNFMKGNWANGQPMTFGGTGQTPTNTPSSYMFPGDSDPLGWATGGTELGTDFKEASAFGDRRFVQSAGPFTLKPGAFNNITVGVIYARGNEGSAYASVDAVKKADTKAQALFDNCFVILDPPMAPKLTIQELENGLVLMLDNPASSNNYKEGYEKEDKIGITIEHLSDGSVPDKYYRFEGYQIYQLKNASASAADIGHEDKARLVAQCDIKNGVSKLINFEYSDELKFDVPTLKVNGGNKGIQHSFKITEDAFASGTKTLVNHKTYYYVAIAYAYNQYKKYDPNDAYLLEGQKIPYISSRLGYDGVQIKSISAIPHNTKPEADGTNQYVDYGDSPLIKRLDGHGNGNRELELTQASKDEIISVGKLNDPVYENQKGPINIKVIDPLNVADGYFELEFNNFDAGSNNVDLNRADTASWTLYRFDKENGTLLDSVNSQVTIANNNEQLIPKYGVSVQINQASYTGSLGSNYFTEPIASSVDFADSTQRWLFGVPDDQSFYATNWIRSGVYKAQDSDTNKADLWRNPACFDDDALADNERKYTKLAGGMFAPHRVTGFQCDYMPLAYYKMPTTSYNMPSPSNSRTNAKIAFLPSVDIVFTNDPSKWTKCPVIELGRDVNLTVGGAVAGGLRKSLSVDKNGNPDGSGTTGMGWFPGYAIDVESGVRLQMAFGENSFLAGDNGADMVWNPTSTFVDASGNPILGGQHAIYVFGYKLKEINGYQNFYDLHEYKESDLEIYDMLKNIETTNNPSDKRDFYSNLAWVGNPVLTPGQKLNACDLTIKIRVSKEYKKYTATGKNNGKPMYSWNTNTMATKKSDISVLSDVLKMVNVVPNPYYAYSSYERNRVDTRVKITNLPEKCTVKIYSVNGKLMRTFKKDSEITSIDWDLNNQIGVAVSSGVYLIHVEVPGVGERVIKFFGGMRQVDLEGI